MDVKEELHRQLNVLKATFCAFCKVGETRKMVPTLLFMLQTFPYNLAIAN